MIDNIKLKEIRDWVEKKLKKYFESKNYSNDKFNRLNFSIFQKKNWVQWKTLLRINININESWQEQEERDKHWLFLSNSGRFSLDEVTEKIDSLYPKNWFYYTIEDNSVLNENVYIEQIFKMIIQKI